MFCCSTDIRGKTVTESRMSKLTLGADFNCTVLQAALKQASCKSYLTTFCCHKNRCPDDFYLQLLTL